jgi:hypothetical protein
MADTVDIVLSIALGLGLAAATGLRVFLPLFLASVLAHFDVGDIDLRANMAWLGDLPVVIALGVATVLEVMAYYVPVLDHFLDTIAVPLSTVAGTLVAVSTFVELPPTLAWGLALIAGGGLAGLISAGTAATRVVSTTTTGTLGNPIVSTMETAGSLLLSILAWFVPLLAFGLVLAVVWVAIWRRMRSSMGTTG